MSVEPLSTFPQACNNLPTAKEDTWVFGYGSLIWRPSFKYIVKRPARIQGWTRRFWQGSHDHRGLPSAPGRVVTLIEDPCGQCDGMAYLLAAETLYDVFEHLDYREKNGYERFAVQLQFLEIKHKPESAVMYVAPVNNHAYLGPESLQNMAAQIQGSSGPSGSNKDYLTELATALRKMKTHDQHVFELEAAVLSLSG